jgi:hypothetical protein
VTLRPGPAATLCAGAVLLAASAPALAGGGRLGGGQPLEVSLGRIVAALVICIIVAVLAALLIRQRAGKLDLYALFGRLQSRPRAIEVVETRRLSPHADICVVRHSGREYLLLLLAGNARILREEPIDRQAEAEAPCA